MNASAQTTSGPWLHRFAVLTAVVTFFLLGIGGLVTSHEAGMSVPDWPTSYGYNMFALPTIFWKGGAFFEHSHRLLASGAGFLTTVLAVWLWIKDPRKWIKWLGIVAFLLVVAQGVLGGLRVTLKMDGLGVIHGVVAQSFFILICAIALFTSRFWVKWSVGEKMFSMTRGLRMLVLATTILIFCQLALGATMRGQHAGLAIPDFPLAYHKFWPDTGVDAVARYNADRVEVISVNPITAFQIELQMIHRCVALAIGILVAFCAWLSLNRLGRKNPLAKLAMFWFALIVCQIALAAWTVWSNKAADVATAHVLMGALSLVTGALWCVIAFGRRDGATKIAPVKTISGAFGT
ncbi:MAG TPA: COX15/CtaA family protein, partial [Verrucomicrobiae bacterium]